MIYGSTVYYHNGKPITTLRYIPEHQTFICASLKEKYSSEAECRYWSVNEDLFELSENDLSSCENEYLEYQCCDCVHYFEFDNETDSRYCTNLYCHMMSQLFENPYRRETVSEFCGYKIPNLSNVNYIPFFPNCRFRLTAEEKSTDFREADYYAACEIVSKYIVSIDRLRNDMDCIFCESELTVPSYPMFRQTFASAGEVLLTHSNDVHSVYIPSGDGPSLHIGRIDGYIVNPNSISERDYYSKMLGRCEPDFNSVFAIDGSVALLRDYKYRLGDDGEYHIISGFLKIEKKQ